MSVIAPEVWTRLSGEPVDGEMLFARRAAPDSTDRLIAALDADQKRHFLVLLLPAEEAMQDFQSRGIGVATRELTMPNREQGRYLDIICLDPSGHDAFNLIGGEIADRLGSARETTAECVTRVLAKWRRFWGQLPRHILSREEQIGLFAELWFLSLWLIPKVGTTEAVTRWRGPFGSRHDFEWRGRSVEVKATASTRGLIHRVNGIDQLSAPENGDLLLFSVRVREEAGATNSLPSIILTCRSLMQDDPESIGLMERALDHVGYSPVHDEEYSKLHLRVIEEALFAVRDDFPRITAAQFLAGVPRGVEKIEYEVNLESCNHLCIARSAAGLPDIF